jgi:hypothetical protein
MSLTPQQWLQSQLITILTLNNPAADPNSIILLATELSSLWTNLILPNLLVNTATGQVNFIVPGGQ